MCNNSTATTFQFDSCYNPPGEFITLYYVLYGILMNLMVIVGLIGNVLNILVFLSPRIWACLNFYLIALALWDEALLISSFAQWGVWSLVFEGEQKIIGPHVTMLYYAYVLGNITLTGCVWVIVTLTIERYLAIIQPLQHRSMNNACRAKVILICVSVGAVLFNISRAFELNIITATCCDTQETITLIGRTQLYRNPTYFILYRVICSSVFITVAPCLILAFLTLRMCLAIRTANAFNSQFSSIRSADSSREMRSRCSSYDPKNKPKITRSTANNSTNKMLSVVMVKFLLCYTLPAVMDLLENFVPERFNDETIIECLIIVNNCLVVLNSCSNFAIYLTTGRRFRHEFQRLSLVCFYRAIGREIPKSDSILMQFKANLTGSNSRNLIDTSSFERSPNNVNKKTSQQSADSVEDRCKRSTNSESFNFLTVPTVGDSAF